MTVAFDFLLMPCTISRRGFFSSFLDRSSEGANSIFSMCLPGSDRLCGIPRDCGLTEALVETGVSTPPVAGVEAREDVVLEVIGPRGFVPLESEFPTNIGFCAPQAVVVAAGALTLYPAPRAGNASSDSMLRVDGAGDFLTFGTRSTSSSAFCFPAAFADMGSVVGTGCGIGEGALAACIDGGGCVISSSSGTSSTVGWWAASALCFS